MTICRCGHHRAFHQYSKGSCMVKYGGDLTHAFDCKCRGFVSEAEMDDKLRVVAEWEHKLNTYRLAAREDGKCYLYRRKDTEFEGEYTWQIVHSKEDKAIEVLLTRLYEVELTKKGHITLNTSDPL